MAVARPKLFNTGRRPSSAIFLGGTPPPALPEPPRTPSPEDYSSERSGLPSPPATNSTGSGSTGDHTTNAGSVRLRSPPTFTTDENNNSPEDMASQHRLGSYRQRSRSRSRSRSHSRSRLVIEREDEDEDLDGAANEEDQTARFSGDRRRSMPTENSFALQRIKDLNERSRMVMDKLTARSRVSTPSPSLSARKPHSRSPLPPSTSTSSAASSSASASSARRSPHSQTFSHRSRTLTSRQADLVLSGSETERESMHSHASSSDLSDIADAPPMTPSVWALGAGGSTRVRERRISAPSPGKAVLAARSRSVLRGARRDGSPAPGLRTPRKRPSTALSVTGADREYDEPTAEFYGATPTVPRRTSTTLGRKTRQPLPREFLDQASDDEPRSSKHASLDLDHDVLVTRGSPSPSALKTPSSPRPPRAGTLAAKSSTVRDLTRRHQTRWMSEDLSSPPDRDDADNPFTANGRLAVGRRQAVRGGSAESPLVAYALGERSLVGEGLRAAGIRARQRSDELAEEQSPVFSHPRRAASTSVAGTNGRGSDQGSTSGAGTSRSAFTPRRQATELAAAPPTSTALVSLREARTPFSGVSRVNGDRASYQGPSASRPNTSMAEYADGVGAAPRTAPLGLRSHRSSYHLSEREPPSAVDDRSPRLSRYADLEPSGRASAVGGARAGTALNGAGTSDEHLRLLGNAYERFEGALAHLPPRGATTAQTVPDLSRQAQGLVRAADRLHGLLADGAQAAMRAHVRASVEDDDGRGPAREDAGELWRAVGAEFREGVRASDELVRVLTEFFLGMGKVLRDVPGAPDGSPAHHLRTLSVDDEGVHARGSPLAGLNGLNGHARGSTDGSVSSGSRRSWAPGAQADQTVRSNHSDGLSGGRPGSALVPARDRDREERPTYIDITTPPIKGQPAPRKLFTPREQREQQLGHGSPAMPAAQMAASDSLETVRGSYEPSPTPVARRGTNASERQRVLQPLTIPVSRPPPLSTLPSESLIQPHTPEESHRRKPSSASIATVRATIAPKLSKVVSGSTTTALTPHTVSNGAGAGAAFPLLTRADSTPVRREHTIAFSRPAAVSISALHELRGGGARERAPPDDAAGLVSPASGSETERPPNRHRTLGARTPRASLEGVREDGVVDGPSKHGTVVPAVRRERRRTVTELFSKR